MKNHSLGGSVILDELAILHGVACAHPVDLLVHLSPEEKRNFRKCSMKNKTGNLFFRMSEGLLSNSSHSKARR